LHPILDDPRASVKRAAFSQVRRGNQGTGYSVRSGSWRYTEWTDANGKLTASQLFDEAKDPAETRNLADDPSHAATVRELAALLVPVRTQR
jgi:arylsulfatase A-like enzyme